MRPYFSSNDIGKYYADKRAEAEKIQEQLKTEQDPAIRKKLEKRLEQARYVGD